MKRVLHVLQLQGVGGVQELVYNLISGLKQQGIESFIYTFKGIEEKYVALYENIGCTIYISPYSVLDLRNLKKIVQFLKLWNVDNLHVHNTIPQIFCSLLLSVSSRRVKGIVTEHSQNSKRRNYKALRFLDELTYAPYHRIVSVSKCVNSTMTNWLKHINKAKFVTINNGIDTNRYINAVAVKRSSLGLHTDDYVIVSIGRLRPEKGFTTLIKTMCLLPDKYKLVIIGEGPQRKELEELANSLHLNKRIVLTGNKNNVENYLKTGDLYISASHTEGFGLTIIEASAAGLPVIGTDIPAFRDLIPQEHLFPVDDCNALAEIILKNDYNPCEELARKYSLNNMIQGYLYVYNS